MKAIEKKYVHFVADPDKYPAVASGDMALSYPGVFDYLRILAGRKWIVVAGLLAGGLMGLGIGLHVVPKYLSSALIEIQDYNSAFLNQREMQTTADAPQQLSDVYLQSQLSVLTSDTVARRVVSRLSLDRNALHIGQSVSPVEEIIRDLGLEPALARLDRNGRPSAVRRLLSLPPAGSQSAVDRAIGVVRKNLKVKALPQSRMVQVQFASPDAQLAKSVADAVAVEFRDYNLESRATIAERTGRLLREQMATAKTDLDTKQNGIQAYARQSGLVILGERHHAAEEKLRQVQADLTKASGERASREAELKISATASPETLGNVLDNQIIRDHSTRLAGLRQELAENAALYTAEFPKVKRLAAQVRELEQILGTERGRLTRRLRNDYDSAVVREGILAMAYREQAKVVSDEAAKTVHYDSLKRDLDAGFGFYRDMSGRLQTADFATALRSSNIRIVDEAAIPALPGKPDLQLLLGLGLASGLLLGIAAAFLRERHERQRRIYRSPGETSLTLQVPELGVIPAIALASTRPLSWRRLGQKTLDDAEVFIRNDSAAMVTEAYSSLVASLLMAENASDARVFAFISDRSGSGKSTTVLNLAMGLVDVGRRVLIIDGDLRRPRLHSDLKVANNWGLSTLISEEQDLLSTPLEQLVRRTEIPDLFLLPSGPGVSNPGRLLASGNLSRLINRLRDEFDMILIDTPPAGLFADARFLGRQADGNILVVRSRQNDPDEIRRIVDRFREDGAVITGTILNEWQDNRSLDYQAAYANYAP
jgi:capsular exopolysaccharide synthesis family protein